MRRTRLAVARCQSANATCCLVRSMRSSPVSNACFTAANGIAPLLDSEATALCEVLMPHADRFRDRGCRCLTFELSGGLRASTA